MSMTSPPEVPFNGRLTLSRGAVIAPLVLSEGDGRTVEFVEAVVTDIDFEEPEPQHLRLMHCEEFRYVRPEFRELELTVKLKVRIPIP